MINLELNEKQKELIKLEYISIFVFKYNQEKIENNNIQNINNIPGSFNSLENKNQKSRLIIHLDSIDM